MDKKEKYCYREVDFYPEGYIGGVFIEEDDGKKMLFILRHVNKDLKSAKKELIKLKKDLKNQKKDPVNVYGGLIIKIKFKRTSPLKKEFWNIDSDINLDNMYRFRQYMEVLGGRENLYQIMVMPAFYNKKKKEWLLTNWLPVLATTTDEELGKIAIMSSETQVDISAKNMALYTIEWVKGLYVETGEMVEKEEEKNVGYNC